MFDTLPTIDDILSLSAEDAASLVRQLTETGQLSALVRDLNEAVLAQGVESPAGRVLEHLGFLV